MWWNDLSVVTDERNILNSYNRVDDGPSVLSSVRIFDGFYKEDNVALPVAEEKVRSLSKLARLKYISTHNQYFMNGNFVPRVFPYQDSENDDLSRLDLVPMSLEMDDEDCISRSNVCSNELFLKEGKRENEMELGTVDDLPSEEDKNKSKKINSEWANIGGTTYKHQHLRDLYDDMANGLCFVVYSDTQGGRGNVDYAREYIKLVSTTAVGSNSFSAHYGNLLNNMKKREKNCVINRVEVREGLWLEVKAKKCIGKELFGCHQKPNVKFVPCQHVIICEYCFEILYRLQPFMACMKCMKFVKGYSKNEEIFDLLSTHTKEYMDKTMSASANYDKYESVMKDLENSEICVICYEKGVSFSICYPCKHSYMCRLCYVIYGKDNQLTECAMCRTPIQRILLLNSLRVDNRNPIMYYPLVTLDRLSLYQPPLTLDEIEDISTTTNDNSLILGNISNVCNIFRSLPKNRKEIFLTDVLCVLKTAPSSRVEGLSFPKSMGCYIDYGESDKMLFRIWLECLTLRCYKELESGTCVRDLSGFNPVKVLLSLLTNVDPIFGKLVDGAIVNEDELLNYYNEYYSIDFYICHHFREDDSKRKITGNSKKFQHFLQKFNTLRDLVRSDKSQTIAADFNKGRMSKVLSDMGDGSIGRTVNKCAVYTFTSNGYLYMDENEHVKELSLFQYSSDDLKVALVMYMISIDSERLKCDAPNTLVCYHDNVIPGRYKARVKKGICPNERLCKWLQYRYVQIEANIFCESVFEKFGTNLSYNCMLLKIIYLRQTLEFYRENMKERFWNIDDVQIKENNDDLLEDATRLEAAGFDEYVINNWLCTENVNVFHKYQLPSFLYIDFIFEIIDGENLYREWVLYGFTFDMMRRYYYKQTICAPWTSAHSVCTFISCIFTFLAKSSGDNIDDLIVLLRHLQTKKRYCLLEEVKCCLGTMIRVTLLPIFYTNGYRCLGSGPVFCI